MDDTYRTGKLIPHDKVHYAFTPHMNHRFIPPFAVTRPLWLDQYLKGSFQFPATPDSKLLLSTEGGVPVFEVKADTTRVVDRVNIYYSVDPDPQARFWRSAGTKKDGDTWTAKLPILSVEQPLFAFANVHYRLKKPQSVPFATPTSTFAISSMLHTAAPENLQRAKVKATDKPSLLIDDFSQGWQNWYQLSENNPHHWQFWTRKITDPKWRGTDGYQLTFDVKVKKANKLVVVVTENFFRPYRGKQEDFVAVVDLEGGNKWQTVKLSPSNFSSPTTKKSLSSWSQIDLLGFRAYYNKGRGKVLLGSIKWEGSQPEFRNLHWMPSK